MERLAFALDSFNRKERNLLVRAILADGALPPLSEAFCELVRRSLGLTIPKDAWWATDYHIDWLAGALAFFVENEGEESRAPEENPLVESRRLVEGTQEDVDLVIATGCNLIFIEAKAYSHFGNSQLEHKLAHLNLLYEFYDRKIRPRSPPEHIIHFHLLITSIFQPTNALKANWPGWACRGQGAPWFKLKLGDPKPVFEVMRCKNHETSDVAEQFWSFRPAKVKRS